MFPLGTHIIHNGVSGVVIGHDPEDGEILISLSSETDDSWMLNDIEDLEEFYEGYGEEELLRTLTLDGYYKWIQPEDLVVPFSLKKEKK